MLLFVWEQCGNKHDNPGYKILPEWRNFKVRCAIDPVRGPADFGFLHEILIFMSQNDQEKYPMNILAKRLNKLVDKSADDLRDMVSQS